MPVLSIRNCLASSILLLLACGGAQKPADAVDTSSLESTPSPSAAGGDTPAASGPSSSGPLSALNSSATPSSPSSDAAPAPAAAMHPVPGATGSIDGKPFSPKLAQIASPMQKDGRVTLILHEGSDCVAAADAKPGDASLMLVVPWQDGYKTDLSALRRAKKGNMGEAAFVRIGDDGKKQVSTTFKPSGLVTVVSAPTQKDAIGKLKIDLQSGDYMVAGDLDVKLCVAAK
ncbi:MAG TPA: hypothetical protein VMI75_35290 [Polyangiaceae bacterium]|nr:hypothetical protein [Polyangiaceae bacterium]